MNSLQNADFFGLLSMLNTTKSQNICKKPLFGINSKLLNKLKQI